MIQKLLIAVGLRSRCCGAKIESWHAGRDICSNCHQWIRKDLAQEAVKDLGAAKVPHVVTPRFRKKNSL